MPGVVGVRRASCETLYKMPTSYDSKQSERMGMIKPIVTNGKPHLAMSKFTLGNTAKLEDGISVIVGVIDLISHCFSLQQYLRT